MRPITDKAKVSREKLAWLCDCTSVSASPPFTSVASRSEVVFGTFATAEAGPFTLPWGPSCLPVAGVYGPMKEGRGVPHHRQGGGRQIPPPLLSRELDNMARRASQPHSALPVPDLDHRHLCHHGLTHLAVEAIVLLMIQKAFDIREMIQVATEASSPWSALY